VWAALVAVGAISASTGLAIAAFAILVGGVALIAWSPARCDGG